MARKKVQLAWIANHSTRNSTLRKRKKGLMKKASELATLCGIKVCVVVYGAEDKQPDVWPSLPEAAEILAALRSMPEMDQNKKMMDREGFMRQRLSKLAEQVRRTERESKELETELLMHQCLAGRILEDASAAEVSRLWWMLDMKMKLVNDRLDRAGVPRGSTFALQDAAIPAVGFDAGLTMITLPPALAEAQQHWPNVAPQMTPMEAAMEELQRQNWLKGKNQAAEAIQMNPQMHGNWQLHARDMAPLGGFHTQNLLLEKKPALPSPVAYPQYMQNDWLAQSSSAKPPMESAMKEPEGHNWFTEQYDRTPVEEALERFQRQQYYSMVEEPVNTFPAVAAATDAGLRRYNCFTEQVLSGEKSPQEPPAAAMNLQSLLMLQCPIKATAALQMHDWQMTETREKGPYISWGLHGGATEPKLERGSGQFPKWEHGRL